MPDIPLVADWSPILSNVQFGSVTEALILILSLGAALYVVVEGCHKLIEAIWGTAQERADLREYDEERRRRWGDD